MPFASSKYRPGVVLRAVLCATLITAPSLCWSADVADLFPKEIIRAFTLSGEEGVLTAFHGEPGTEKSELQLTFRAAQEEPFILHFLAQNQTSTTHRWRLLFFCDYARIAVEVEKKKTETLEFSLPPGETQTLTFSFPPLPAGRHDLLVLGVPIEDGNPYNFHYRANLDVGSPSRDQHLVFPPLTATSPARSDHFDFGFMALDEPGEIDLTKVGAKQRLHLVAQNRYDEVCRYAAIVLKDHFPVRREFFQLPAKMAGKVVTLDPGARYQAILIEQPFLALEQEPGVITEGQTNVTFSNVVDSDGNFRDAE